MPDQPEKPEGWEREGEEIRQRYGWAEAMGGEEAVRLRHEKGFLTVRERIAGIADPDSFQEVGKLTGKGQYDEQGRVIKVTPAPYVMGIAEVDGRPVAIGGEDTTVRGGTSWGHGRRKGGQGGFIDDTLMNQAGMSLAAGFVQNASGGLASTIAPALKAGSVEAYKFIAQQNEKSKQAAEAKKLWEEQRDLLKDIATQNKNAPRLAMAGRN